MVTSSDTSWTPPEQGLLTLVVWSDIQPRGGGTFVAADSVPVVARYLAAHPEGVLPTEFPTKALIAECSQFVEATGRVGDVFLLHPYVLHAKSQNHLGVPRLITNPPVHLKEPMNFNRPDPADYSPVELAVLRGLGVDRLDFRPAAPRAAVVPKRVARQQRMLEEEKARLAATFGVVGSRLTVRRPSVSPLEGALHFRRRALVSVEARSSDTIQTFR